MRTPQDLWNELDMIARCVDRGDASETQDRETALVQAEATVLLIPQLERIAAALEGIEASR